MVSVSVVKAVSTPTWVDVMVSNSVTVVVAGASDSHEEQNDSPAAGSAPTAARHFGEPHDETQPAATRPGSIMPAPMHNVEGLILQDLGNDRRRNECNWSESAREKRTLAKEKIKR